MTASVRRDVEPADRRQGMICSATVATGRRLASRCARRLPAVIVAAVATFVGLSAGLVGPPVTGVGSAAAATTTTAPVSPTPAGSTVLLDDLRALLGDGWTRAPAADGSGALWQQGDRFVQIDVAARPSCSADAVDPRLAMVGSIVGLGAQPTGGDGRVTRYAGELAGTASLAAVFDTARFTFLVLLLGTPAESDAMATDLDRIVAAQAALDGGVVRDRSVADPANLAAQALIDRSPVPGVVGPIAGDATFATCGPDVNRALRYISGHASRRVAVFLGSAGAIVAVDLVRYPFDLLAAAASGTAFTSYQRVDRRGLELPRDAVLLARVGQPDQMVVVFRRGRFSATVTVQAPGGAAALLAAQFAVAQAARLPAGATSTYRFPTPGASVARSGALVTLLGGALLLVRRLRAGRVRRGALGGPAPGPGPLVVDVSARGATMRRRGALLTVAQVATLVVVFVGLSADIGIARWIMAAAGVAIAMVATTWARRRDEGHLGPLGRHRQPPSLVSAAVGVLAVATLVAGSALAVRGLQEVAFKPSLTHLRLADRLSIEPRRLAWLIAAIGLLAVIGGIVAVRVARSLARIGWRRSGVDAAPVVYLRSFHDDDLTLPCVASARRPWIEVLGLRAREPFEEAMAWELASYGPVIAIGRPGGRRASLGAALEHLADDAWQRVIADRLAAARAVIVTIGATEGLAWELDHLARAGHLGKTTFLVPPVPDADTAARWSFTSGELVRAGLRVAAATLAGVPASSAITIQLDGRGACVVHAADRRDEATYRAALDEAVARQSR